MIPNQITKRYLLPLYFIFNCILLHSQQGIGTNEPDLSSALEVSSQDKGVLIPRMTTSERDLIIQPGFGLLIFNTDAICVEINTSTNSLLPTWECLDKGPPIISSLNCHAATLSGTILKGQPANVTLSLPYGGGDASSYASGTVLAYTKSAGSTALTANLQTGTLSTGTGALTYTISGTTNTLGNVYFNFEFGGQHCVLVIPVKDSSI